MRHSDVLQLDYRRLFSCEKIFSGDAPLVSIFVCILAVRIGETGVSWSMGKVVEDRFLLTE